MSVVYLDDILWIGTNYEKCKVNTVNTNWTNWKINSKLIAVSPAVKYGFFYTKNLEREKTKALLRSNMNYDKKIKILKSIISDLHWRIKKLPNAKNCIKTGEYKIEIFTDASNSGWGAINGNWKV